MSESEGVPTVHFPIDIPAKFIHQALEHIERTGARYVTLMFSGEYVADAVCTGVSTKLMITDPPPKVVRPPEPAATATPQATPKPTSTKWTVQTITDDVVLGVVRDSPVPLGTKQVGDTLGIPGSEVLVRQRVRRVLLGLLDRGMIRNTGDGHYASFVYVGSKPMPIRPQPRRTITRKQITNDMVLQQIQQTDRISSKNIGDKLGIPRNDNIVRSKITHCVRELIKAGLVRQSEQLDPGGGRLYEMERQEATEATEAENSVDMQV